MSVMSAAPMPQLVCMALHAGPQVQRREEEEMNRDQRRGGEPPEGSLVALAVSVTHIQIDGSVCVCPPNGTLGLRAQGTCFLRLSWAQKHLY